MTFSNPTAYFSSIEELDLFGFSDYSLNNEIQDQILHSLFDSLRSDYSSDECHPNDLRDMVRSRLNYPIREPYEPKYLHWADGEDTVH